MRRQRSFLNLGNLLMDVPSYCNYIIPYLYIILCRKVYCHLSLCCTCLFPPLWPIPPCMNAVNSDCVLLCKTALMYLSRRCRVCWRFLGYPLSPVVKSFCKSTFRFPCWAALSQESVVKVALSGVLTCD